MQFDKFSLKGTSWLKPGNFKICDEEGELAYSVTSNAWKFKKEFKLLSKHNDIVYHISSNSSLSVSFNLYEQDRLIAQINKPLSWSNQLIEIETEISDPFIVKGNIWGNEYKFIRDETDFAIVSYKIWSSGVLGVAIKKGELIPLILAVVIIIAHLKQSGMA